MSTGAPWDHGVGQWVAHIDVMCVLCVAPAGFASGWGGDLEAGVPICSGRSPSDMMLAFYWTFPFLSRFAREGLCTNNQNVKCVVLHSLPKALKQLKNIYINVLK